MDQLYGGGGDYHTTYWPQPSYLSSRKYYIESTFQGYHELDFSEADRNTVYWHRYTSYHSTNPDKCVLQHSERARSGGLPRLPPRNPHQAHPAGAGPGTAC